MRRKISIFFLALLFFLNTTYAQKFEGGIMGQWDSYHNYEYSYFGNGSIEKISNMRTNTYVAYLHYYLINKKSYFIKTGVGLGRTNFSYDYATTFFGGNRGKARPIDYPRDDALGVSTTGYYYDCISPTFAVAKTILRGDNVRVMLEANLAAPVSFHQYYKDILPDFTVKRSGRHDIKLMFYGISSQGLLRVNIKNKNGELGIFGGVPVYNYWNTNPYFLEDVKYRNKFFKGGVAGLSVSW